MQEGYWGAPRRPGGKGAPKGPRVRGVLPQTKCKCWKGIARWGDRVRGGSAAERAKQWGCSSRRCRISGHGHAPAVGGGGSSAIQVAAGCGSCLRAGLGGGGGCRAGGLHGVRARNQDIVDDVDHRGAASLRLMGMAGVGLGRSANARDVLSAQQSEDRRLSVCPSSTVSYNPPPAAHLHVGLDDHGRGPSSDDGDLPLGGLLLQVDHLRVVMRGEGGGV